MSALSIWIYVLSINDRRCMLSSLKWEGVSIICRRARRAKSCMQGGAESTLLQGRQREAYLLDFHVSYFLLCRPAISCSSSDLCRTSQTFRPISTSCCSLYTSSVRTMPTSAAPHIKSRCPQYPGSKVKRFLVPDDKVDWSKTWPQYNPVSHTDPAVTKKPAWADPDIG